MFKKLGIVLGIIIALFGAYKAYEFNKSEREREASNYENLLEEFTKLDSTRGAERNKLIEYNFRKDKELKDYLKSTDNQLKGLYKQLNSANLKLSRVTRIVSTSIKARDTIINKINIDSLVQKLTTLQPFTMPFTDVTNCFEIKGNFNFDGEKTNLVFTDRAFNDVVTRVDSWYRDKHRWVFGFKTGLFMPKKLKRSEFSKCTGKTETIIIKKGK